MHRSRRLRLHRQARQQLTPAFDAPIVAQHLREVVRLEKQPELASTASIEEIETKLLLEGVALRYGYDFREYALAPLKRSIASGMAGEGVPTISAYQERPLHHPTPL